MSHASSKHILPTTYGEGLFRVALEEGIFLVSVGTIIEASHLFMDGMLGEA